MANEYFTNYLDGLTKKQRMVAEEAVSQYLASESKGVTKITCAEDLFRVSRHLSFQDVESLYLICLNTRLNIIKKVEISRGGLNESLVDVRVVMREALINNSVNIAIVHNHPTGEPMPSKADEQLTKNIKAACDVMHIRLTDHVIVAGNKYYSFYESGKI